MESPLAQLPHVGTATADVGVSAGASPARRPNHLQADRRGAPGNRSAHTQAATDEVPSRLSFDHQLRAADARMVAALTSAPSNPRGAQTLAGERPDDSVPGLCLGDLFVNGERWV